LFLDVAVVLLPSSRREKETRDDEEKESDTIFS
jgi:hypothetical protein